MPVTITLQQIRDEGPCAPGWTKLLTNLGNPPLDTHVSLGDIAASNGAQHALWASRCLPESERRNVVMCVLPAVKRAAEHSTDDSVHACIEAIERWVNGDDSVNLWELYT